jgi:hypothetical protein
VTQPSALRGWLRWRAMSPAGGVAGLVLAHGVPFTPSPWSAWSTEYERGPAGQCTRTSWLLVEGSESPVWYCEGFAAQAAVVVEHAWAVTEDGRALDATWIESPRYLLARWAYYGIPFASEFVREQHDAHRCYSILPTLARGRELPAEAIAEPWRAAA